MSDQSYFLSVSEEEWYWHTQNGTFCGRIEVSHLADIATVCEGCLVKIVYFPTFPQNAAACYWSNTMRMIRSVYGIWKYLVSVEYGLMKNEQPTHCSDYSTIEMAMFVHVRQI